MLFRQLKRFIAIRVFLAVAFEDGRPAEDQGPVRGEQGRSTTREPELAAEGVRHPEIKLHEAEEAPSAVQATQNRTTHVRATRRRSTTTLRALQRGRADYN